VNGKAFNIIFTGPGFDLNPSPPILYRMIMIDKDRLVRTLQELVRIPSHESMEEISGYVVGEIRKLGLKPEVDGDGNVLVSVGSGPGLLLNAHMDTVGVENYPEAFSGEVKGDKLFGRGSTDDKSGVAAMIEILRVLKENPPRKRAIFAFTVWEEGGGEDKDGAYKVAEKVDPTHAIVLESGAREDGRMSVDIGCKGRFLYGIEVFGKAAHSGSPDKGINSIYLASKLIEKLKRFETVSEKTSLGGKINSLLSVTQIEANEGHNIIPGKCTLTVDYRSLPSEKEKEVRKRLEKVCEETLGKSFSISHMHKPKRGFVQHDAKFIGLCTDSVREAGLEPFTRIIGGWFDGEVFNRKGAITVNLGPGTRYQAHRTPEYCWIPGFVKGTQAVLNSIRRWDSS
jgi:succinyl-diaminopimelate desuccinylase